MSKEKELKECCECNWDYVEYQCKECGKFYCESCAIDLGFKCVCQPETILPVRKE
jgi:hypothetical protein